MKSFIFVLTILVLSCSLIRKNLKCDFKEIEKFYIKTTNLCYKFLGNLVCAMYKKLPYFEQIQEKFKKDVEVILISLDFPSQYETKLIPFLEKRQLKSKVIVLDDVAMNTWITKINPNWDGAIPVTLIYNSENRQFYPQSFIYDELA